MPFDKSQMEVGANAPSWMEKNKQLVNSAVKYGALIIVALLLLFFVLRPAKKALKVAMAPPVEPKLLAEATNNADEAERRNADGMENALIEAQPLMTVAELEAKMQTEESLQVSQTANKLEVVRKNIVEQSIKDSEVVVGTLRGWLRE